jgi:hypothetical protein
MRGHRRTDRTDAALARFECPVKAIAAEFGATNPIVDR